jgi:hypothetical protein
MSGFEFPEAPEIETAYRTAYEALRAIAPRPSIDSGRALTISELICQFGRVAEEAELAAAAQIEPLVGWRGPEPEQGKLGPVSAVVDLDSGDYSSDDIRLRRDAYEGIDGTWHGSALDYAGRTYKRECGWDVPPGEAGVWLLMLVPVQGVGARTTLGRTSGTSPTADQTGPTSQSDLDGSK